MLVHKPLSWLVLLVAGLVVVTLAASAAPALAASMSVNPVFGGYGTTFTVTAEGFHAKEVVDTWVTLPNLKSVSLGKQTADGAGKLVFTYKPSSSAQTGEYIAVAHGKSGLQVSVKFNLVAPPRDTTPVPTPITGISVDPRYGGYDTTFTITAGGFSAGQLVDTWLTRSNLKSVSLGERFANSSGVVEFDWKPGSNALAGEYIFVVHARSTGRELFVKGYLVAPPSEPTATPTSTTGISVSPVFGGRSTIFTIEAGGFGANELINTWVTLPNLTSVSLGQRYADSSGEVTFTYTANSGSLAGEYIAVAHAKSGRELFVKFNIVASAEDPTATPTPSVTRRINVDPVYGSYGTRFTITVEGLGAGEVMDTWLTLPNLWSVSMGQRYADSSGKLVFTFTPSLYSPDGEYIAVARSRSGEQLVVKFNYVATPID